MTTTLAPTSSERILEVMVDDTLALPPAVFLTGLRAALSAAAAAWAARRAAAMKLDVLTGPEGPGALGEIPLIAFSEAAMRSDGEAARAAGLVPGSSGMIVRQFRLDSGARRRRVRLPEFPLMARAAAAAGGCTARNSRGAAAKCACAAAGFGNSVLVAEALRRAVRGLAAEALAVPVGAIGGGATGWLRTERRSPSIIASR